MGPRQSRKGFQMASFLEGLLRFDEVGKRQSYTCGLSEINDKRDYVSHERFVNEPRTGVFQYRKREWFFKPGDWRGEHWKPISRSLGPGQIWLTGHSDGEFDFLDFVRAKAAGANLVLAGNFSGTNRLGAMFGGVPLPLGPQLSELQDSPLSEAFSMASPFQARDVLVYSNFLPGTAPALRGYLSRLVPELPHVRAGRYNFSSEGRAQFLQEIGTSKFTLCPEGNGLDTHRFWEVLYLGGIPVVIRGSYSDRVAKLFGLPALALNNWDDLRNVRALEEQAFAYAGKLDDFNPSALRGSRWIENIHSFRRASARQPGAPSDVG